jgi:acylphosphatase
MIGERRISIFQILIKTPNLPRMSLISGWIMMKTKQRLHARVTGRVQGVGFRYFVMTKANELGLVGWVRNRRDGSVEVVAEGELDILKQLVRVLERGSRSSMVEDVKAELQEASGEFQSFNPRPTL